MSTTPEVPAEVPANVPATAPDGATHVAAPADRGAVIKDVLVVLVSFAVAAVLVGLIWPHLVDPVVVERTDAGLLTDEVALGDRFDVVGWYALLAAGAGLLLGAVLAATRRTHEVVTLLAVVACACLAAWLSAEVGSWVGPDDPNQVLADAEVGDTAEDRIVLTADVAYLVWPVAALIGSATVLWSRPGHRETTSAEGRGDSRT
jgi:hypothetical protein